MSSIRCDIYDPEEYDIWFAAAPYGAADKLAKTLKTWAAEEQADVVYNLCLFNMTGSGSDQYGVIRGRTLQYLKAKGVDCGYGGTAEHLTVSTGNVVAGVKVAVRDGVVLSGLDKSTYRSRNLIGALADSRIIVVQSSDGCTEEQVARYAAGKYAIKLLLVQDAGGSTGMYRVSDGYLFAPEREGTDGRPVCSVVCMRKKNKEDNGNMGKKYGTTRNFWDVPLPLPELWEAVKWAVKPDGAILFFAQCPYDKVLGASNLKMLRYEWMWYKSRCTGFLNARRAPLKKTENILVFYQKLPLYQPQFEQGKPYQRITKTSSLSSNYGKFTRTGAGSEDGRRFPGNVLAFASVQRTIHPTQKPVELCEYFIRTYTRPGELVADICAGSGTTAVAALNTGRRYICYETAPAIFSTAAQRIREAEEAVARGEKVV